MLTFDAPQFLLLFILFPVIWLLPRVYRSRARGLPFSLQAWGNHRDYLSSLFVDLLLIFERILFWCGVASLIIAIAGPVRVNRRESYASRGLDIMIVLDSSPSMAAMDFGVENRLETAKSMIRPFVESRENDSFGLISFSSQADLLLPPTVDRDLFLEKLESMEISSMDQGTSIGMGLALGILHLSSSQAERKVLLLMTDGENNIGEITPDTAVSMARQLNVAIYTIGIGTTGEIQLEFLDPESGKIISGTFNSRFDEELLKEIASETGGSYYRAISTATLSTIFKNIDTRETGERLTRLLVEKEYLHRWFIMASLILIFTALFLRRLVLREVL